MKAWFAKYGKKALEIVGKFVWAAIREKAIEKIEEVISNDKTVEKIAAKISKRV